MKLLCIMALMAAATFNAFVTPVSAVLSPPEFIPHRFQDGDMYKTALKEQLEASEAAMVRLQKNGVLSSSYEPLTQNTTENFFEQWIDHNDHSKGTFKQRFFVDYRFWDGKSPACIMISGENTARGSPAGYVQEYGASINALLFTLEHRWYGNSALSTNYSDMSLLRTLTIDNALADVVGFLDYVDNTFIGQTLKWFAVGGSYAGGLSAWLKVVYPDRVAASWSSSGVTNPKFDYYEYEGHIVSVLPPLCANTIKMAIQQIEQQWDTPEGYAAVQSMFGLANMSKSEFSYFLGDIYAGPVQYGNKARMCEMLVPMRKDPLAQFVEMNALINGHKFASRFVQSRLNRNPDVVSADIVGDIPNMAGWLWNFQCCSEMAFWQVGYPDIGTEGTCLRPTSLTTDGFMDVCARDYGAQWFPDVYALRKRLGGAFPKATNVIAFQASDDPFGPAGVNSQVNPEYPFVLAQCDGCGHCLDLKAPTATDPPSLVQQRITIAQYLNKWLGTAFNVTFVTNGKLTAADTRTAIQAAVVASLPGQTSLSAMVYACDIDGVKCYSTFTTEAAAEKAIGLANNGTIAGVKAAYISENGGGSDASDSGNGLGHGTIAGIVVGAVAGFLILLAGIVIIVGKRNKDEGSYSTVNESLH